MLYYPDPFVPTEAQAAARGIQFWPSSGGYRGFVGAKAPRRPKGTVVVLHGNAGTAADRTWYVDALEPLGYRVILAEYPGYGQRRGKPGEAVFVADACETLRQASAEFSGPLLLLGESLGCGVAAAVAKDPPVRVDKLVLVTPWDNLLSVAKEHFPLVPVGLFLADKYDSAANLKAFDGRVAVAAAEQDEVIPLRHAKDLYASLSCAKRLWVIPRAGHNDWVEHVGRAWWEEVMGFVEGAGPVPGKE